MLIDVPLFDVPVQGRKVRAFVDSGSVFSCIRKNKGNGNREMVGEENVADCPQVPLEYFPGRP